MRTAKPEGTSAAKTRQDLPQKTMMETDNSRKFKDIYEKRSVINDEGFIKFWGKSWKTRPLTDNLEEARITQKRRAS